jgi:hypothetical protein
MPKCDDCGSNMNDTGMFKLVHTEQASWKMLCHKCAKIQNIKSVSSTPKNHNNYQSEIAKSPNVQKSTSAVFTEDFKPKKIAETPLTDEILLEISAALENLHDTQKDAKKNPHGRNTQRKNVKLDAIIIVPSTNALVRGKVLDISPTGVKCIMPTEFVPGSLLDLQIMPPDSLSINGMINAKIAVKRTRTTDNGKYEIAATFDLNSENKSIEDRKTKRYPILLDIYYRHDNGKVTLKGHVCNISDGGMCIQVTHSVMQDEHLSFVLRGREGPFAKSDLRGVAQVIRIGEWDENLLEVGVKFITKRVIEK